MRRLGAILAPPLVALVITGSAAGAVRDARVAALQVALRASCLYRGGKEGLLGFFVGQVMKETQGKADPKVVNDLLREKLRA